MSAVIQIYACLLDDGTDLLRAVDAISVAPNDRLTTLETFNCGDHSFKVDVTESCMVRTVTLHVVVVCGRGKEESLHEIEIFKITEGDHVWNTLVRDGKQEGFINYAPCVWYLRICAKDFSSEHPQPLRFGSLKKAWQFSAENLRRPVNVSGHPHSVPYPGSILHPRAPRSRKDS